MYYRRGIKINRSAAKRSQIKNVLTITVQCRIPEYRIYKANYYYYQYKFNNVIRSRMIRYQLL